MEDESIRAYIGRISEITAGIKAQGGTKDDDEVIWRILKTLNTTIQVSSLDDTVVDIMYQRFHKGDIAWET